MSYFPAFLDIRDRKCVVVGGGAVALRKARSLLEAKAQVWIVSPTLRGGLNGLRNRGRVKWLRRSFRPGDLRGAFLAIAATDDPQVNLAVWKTAMRQKALVNVVDDPPHCTFVAPSIVRKGKLQLAISTSGASPAIAKDLRKKFTRELGPEYSMALNWMGRARRQVFQRIASPARRKGLFSTLAATDIPGGIKRYGRAEAKKRFDSALRKLLIKFESN